MVTLLLRFLLDLDLSLDINVKFTLEDRKARGTMIIRVDEIPEGGKDLLFTGDEPGLKEALQRLTDPADVQIDPHIAGRLRVVRDGDLVYLVGPIAGTVSHQCSRCLEAFTEERQIEVDLVFRRAGRTRLTEDPLDAEADEEAVLYEGNEFDPTDALVQEFMLDMPINPLCKEDCPGLCQYCGALKGSDQCCGKSPNEVNPRWAALDELKKKLSS